MKAIVSILFCLLLASVGFTAGEDAGGVQVVYLANAGFLLAGEEGTILIDAFVEKRYLEYAAVPAGVRRAMLSSKPPFDSIDLALVSHAHRDHFQADFAASFLSLHPETRLISSPDVVAALKEVAPDLDESRIEAVLPEPGESKTIEQGAIRVEVLRLPHGGARNQDLHNLAHVIHLGGRRIVHTGDAAMDAASFAPYELSERDLDVVMIPDWYYKYREGKEVIAEHLQARHVIAVHVRPGMVLPTRMQLGEDIHVFMKALDSKRY